MYRNPRVQTLVALVLSACLNGNAQTDASALNRLADAYVDKQLKDDPTISYFTGLPTLDQDRFADRTPKAIAARYSQESEELRLLRRIKTKSLSNQDRATYANLREQLESDLQLRVCRTELWDVNHFDGWQTHFVEVAARQPVNSTKEKDQALRRWSTLPHFIDVEESNLKLGLAQGYSAPKSVVRRVVQQIGALAVRDPDNSPFYSPAKRSGDAAYQKSFRRIIVQRINPALLKFRDFLQTEYLPNAREGVAVSDLPQGGACYQAFLRANTTLQRTPQEISDLGSRTVEENISAVSKIGETRFQTSDLQAIVANIKNDPKERFQSRDDLLAFSTKYLQRTKRVTADRLIDTMPQQDVVIQPLSALEESAGVGSRFQQEPDPAKPSVYLINLGDWKTETRADAEIVTVHETVPGHALQKAFARELQTPTRLSRLIDNSAYVEGWARYAEALAEEFDIYDTEDAAVMRRLWPARGMVVDPGLHALHWTREQAVNYIVASGHFTQTVAEDYVDRIAVMPGQLTSYDTGGLEIKELRKEAETKLGSRFDIRSFDHAVLDDGVVPLPELRTHIKAWIVEQTR